MADISAAGGLGAGAVGDLFGGIAGFEEAGAYFKAADIAQENAKLSLLSGQLQTVALNRQAYQTESSQKAEVAGAGFQAGGSAGDLLRSSTQQASLAKGTINLQSQIQELGFEQQSEAYNGQGQAAQAKGAGGILGGIIQGAAALALMG